MAPKITGIAHVELSVSDLDASVAWYCRVLGAKDVWRGRNEDCGFRACAIDDQGFEVALNLRDPDGIALEFYVLRPR